jgi:hypothetical protein
MHLGEATRSLDLEVVIEESHDGLGEIATGFNRRNGSTYDTLRRSTADFWGTARSYNRQPCLKSLLPFHAQEE